MAGNDQRIEKTELTPKERRALEALLSGKNKGEAALAAGVQPRTLMRIPAKAITDSGPCRSPSPGMAIMEKDDNAEIEIIPLSNLDGQGCGPINREQMG